MGDGLRTLENRTFLLLTVAISLAFAWILWPFYGAVLWATILAIVFAPVCQRPAKSMRQRPSPRSLSSWPSSSPSDADHRILLQEASAGSLPEKPRERGKICWIKRQKSHLRARPRPTPARDDQALRFAQIQTPCTGGVRAIAIP